MSFTDLGGVITLAFIIAMPFALAAAAYLRDKQARRIREQGRESGSILFEQVASTEELEALIEGAPEKSKHELTLWLYAMRRSTAHGLHRPHPMDIARLNMRMISYRPSFLALKGSLLVMLIGLSAFIFYTGVTMRHNWTMIGAVAVMMIGIASQVYTPMGLAKGLGADGKAMRLVWSAATVDSQSRSQLLEAAIQLDPEKGLARTHGTG